MSHCFIIAEAGVNHNGSFEMAMKLVELAASVGADAVKFQTFNPEALATANAPKADYQRQAVPEDNSMLAMLQKLQLNEDEYYRLQEHCKSLGITFLSTPFDIESMKFLVDKMGLKKIKIGSGDVTYAPLLLETAKRGCSIILSTGMSTLGEIEDALAVLSYGYLNQNSPNSYEEVIQQFYLKRPWDLLKEKVVLLHCVSNYPAAFEEANLSVLATLRQAFGLKVGYSDHTLGIEAPIAAVALGAEVIEKHITLDNTLPGPDHKASLEGPQFKQMVDSIRHIEKALGERYKAPAPSEIQMAKIARRAIVASKKITKNQIIALEDLAYKRPGVGLSPMLCWDLVGTKALSDYETDQCIEVYSKAD